MKKSSLAFLFSLLCFSPLSLGGQEAPSVQLELEQLKGLPELINLDVLEKFYREEGTLFKKGISAYKTSDYPKAILILDQVYRLNGPLAHKALFYIMAAQFITNQEDWAQANLKSIDPAALEPQERKRLARLKKKYFPLEETPQADIPLFVDVTPYLGQTGYDANTTKESSSFQGLSLGLAKEAYRLDFGLESLALTYLPDSGTPAFSQKQLTLLGSFFPTPEWSVKLGFTAISNNIPTLDGVRVFSFGLDYQEPLIFQTGITYSHSLHPNYLPQQMDVIQLSPYFGKNWGHYETFGLFQFVTRYILIRPQVPASNSQIFDPLVNKSYHSLEFLVKYWKDIWTFEGGFWIGKQNLAVKNNGFIVYNLSEEHTGGLKASAHVSFTKNFSGGLSFSSDNFTDSTSRAASTSQGVLLDLTWKNY